MVILGSTGSIGTQALDIIRRNPDRFRVVALTAGGGQPELLARQAVEFGVPVVAVADEGAAASVEEAIRAESFRTNSAVSLASHGPNRARAAGEYGGPSPREITVLEIGRASCRERV